VRPPVAQCHPEKSIQTVQFWPRPFAFEDTNLLAEREDLKGHIASTAEKDANHGQ